MPPRLLFDVGMLVNVKCVNLAGMCCRFTKKSWFGALMGPEKDEHCFVMIKDKNIGQIKADLIHAFLCVSTSVILLVHSVGSCQCPLDVLSYFN